MEAVGHRSILAWHRRCAGRGAGNGDLPEPAGGPAARALRHRWGLAGPGQALRRGSANSYAASRRPPIGGTGTAA
ncbi:Hypothetical protein I596_2504 [Dokdonella koreensis DS-123]|uniref:Uncharacterized protein n=1 Tax=Dokdonella koreensis DS-123 TaxID=1300342 RepID=A0A160DVD8_9GAMM|nr:Hypothetical protein I596_2504 [Dokdonella koreensis DS-123]